MGLQRARRDVGVTESGKHMQGPFGTHHHGGGSEVLSREVLSDLKAPGKGRCQYTGAGLLDVVNEAEFNETVSLGTERRGGKMKEKLVQLLKRDILENLLRDYSLKLCNLRCSFGAVEKAQLTALRTTAAVQSSPKEKPRKIVAVGESRMPKTDVWLVLGLVLASLLSESKLMKEYEVYLRKLRIQELKQFQSDRYDGETYMDRIFYLVNEPDPVGALWDGKGTYLRTGESKDGVHCSEAHLLGRVLMGLGREKSQARPYIPGRVGLGSGLGSGPGLKYFSVNGGIESRGGLNFIEQGSDTCKASRMKACVNGTVTHSGLRSQSREKFQHFISLEWFMVKSRALAS
ncbi:hypothetical protein C8R43DRAFT_1203367 [Mycena crocata]|nr:hypothetical protein C8R43DRAFT_1203367 [Mycena crocata]